MAGVTTSEMLDLLATTTEALPKNVLPFETNLQKYEVCNRWFAKDKVEVEGGTRITKKVVLDDNGAARHVRAYQVEATGVVDVVSTLKADWVRADTHWNIERSEVAMNRSGQNAEMWSRGFIKLIKTNRGPSMVSLADLLESRAWMVPAVDSDNLTPLGLPYWVPKLAAGQAATAAGFYGGMYSAAFTAVGGIIPATANSNTVTITGGKPRWRSYQAAYTAVNDFLIEQLALMFYSINFQSPLLAKDLVGNSTVANHRIYLNKQTLVKLEKYMRQSNDQIGSDLAKYMGMTSFKRQPLIHMPILDSTGAGEAGQYDPVYMINHNSFKTYVLEDFYLVEREPIVDKEQHNVFTTFVDLQYAYLCWSRRQQGCCNKVA